MDNAERRKVNRLLRRPNPLGSKVSTINKQKGNLLRGSAGGSRYAKTHPTVNNETETNKQMTIAQSNKQQQGFHVDLAKLCADMCGVANLSNAAAQTITRHLKQVASLLIDNIIRVMEQSLRGVPQPYDVDVASVMIGLEAPFGTGTVNFLPIRTGGRTATTNCGPGGKVFYIRPDKEIDVKTLLLREPAGVVYDVSLAAHWLAVNGKQPTTPQNPPPDFISRMSLFNGASAWRQGQARLAKAGTSSAIAARVARIGQVASKFRCPGTTSVVDAPAPDGNGASSGHLQELSAVTVGRRPHQVSQELMVYFRELTEACVGASENRRHEALENVTMDPGLQPILPYLITFITEGVRVNVMNHNLAILIYLMRLVKALVDNGHISLEPYLHLLVPTVITCVLSRQLCAKPITDNHWALRDFAAKQLATLCNRYNSPTNELYNRVTRELARALCQWIDGGSGLAGAQSKSASQPADDTPAAGLGSELPPGNQTGGSKRLRILGSAVQSMNTLYGLLVALSEFGAQCLRILVFPLLPALCQRLIRLTSTGAGGVNGARLSPADQRSFDSLKAMMSTRIASLLSDWRIRQNAGTSAEDYRNAYSDLATCLLVASRCQSAHPMSRSSTSSSVSTKTTTGPLVVVSSSTPVANRPLLLASTAKLSGAVGDR